MSYDLDFLRPADSAPPPPDALPAWFRGRPNYRIDDETGVAAYGNAHTGVYFSFRTAPPAAVVDADHAYDGPPDDGLAPGGLFFEINYGRPHVFGLEAAPELQAVVSRFGLAVDDSQHEGMGRGAFSEAGFLRGWNANNAFAYRVLFGHGEGSRPDAALLARAEVRREAGRGSIEFERSRRDKQTSNPDGQQLPVHDAQSVQIPEWPNQTRASLLHSG